MIAFKKQQEALDKEADASEKTKNDEIKVNEDSISSKEKLYQLAIERISTDWNGLFDDLKLWNYEYGNTLASELVSARNAAYEAVKDYG